MPDGILGALIFFSAVRKKPRFTHDRGNLRGDMSGKRFSTHGMERKRGWIKKLEIPCKIGEAIQYSI